VRVCVISWPTLTFTIWEESFSLTTFRSFRPASTDKHGTGRRCADICYSTCTEVFDVVRWVMDPRNAWSTYYLPATADDATATLPRPLAQSFQPVAHLHSKRNQRWSQWEGKNLHPTHRHRHNEFKGVDSTEFRQVFWTNRWRCHLQCWLSLVKDACMRNKDLKK